MAFSKITLNGTTLIDLTADTAAANRVLSGYYATGADGVRFEGTYAPNLQTKNNITPTESSQTISADNGYDGLNSV